MELVHAVIGYMKEAESLKHLANGKEKLDYVHLIAEKALGTEYYDKNIVDGIIETCIFLAHHKSELASFSKSCFSKSCFGY